MADDTFGYRPRIRRGLVALIGLWFVLALAPHRPALAAPIENYGVDVVGVWGNPKYSLAVAGRYAYVGLGNRVDVVDLQNLDGPRVVGASDDLRAHEPPFYGEYPQDIVVDGNRAFVAGWAGLFILDVSDPHRPRTVRWLDYPSSHVLIDGSHVYVFAQFSYGAVVTVLDMRDPATVHELGRFEARYLSSLVVRGGVGYAISQVSQDANDELWVLDTSDPARIRVTARSELAEAQESLYLDGNRLFIVGTDGVHIDDVSDAGRPREAGFIKGSLSNCSALAVQHGSRYLACYDHVYYIDLSAQSGPRLVDAPVFQKGILNLAPLGDDRIVALGVNPYLTVVDVSDPAVANRMMEMRLPTSAVAVALDDHVAFVAGLNEGTEAIDLHIVDIGDPAKPVPLHNLSWVAHTIPSAEPVRIAADQGHVVLGLGSSGMLVFDVSKPTHPTLLKKFDAEGIVKQVALNGRWLLAAVDHSRFSNVMRYDLNAPGGPSWISSVPLPGHPAELQRVNDLVYVATAEGQLLILGPPEAPDALAPVGNLQVDVNASALWVQGTLAYVASYSGAPPGLQSPNDTLHIIDISDPARPKQVNAQQIDFSDRIDQIRASGDLMAMHHFGGFGAAFFSIKRPDTPRFVRAFTDSPLRDLTVRDGLAYLAFEGPNRGLTIVRPNLNASWVYLPRTVRNRE